jgi:hypothetical protein
MVTMQKNDPAVQTFSLTINAVPGDGQEDAELQAKVGVTSYHIYTIHQQVKAHIVIYISKARSVTCQNIF